VEKVDVRIIAATHRNLAEMVAEGSFRADLYYRLNVVELEVPPLRHRKEDIPLLVRHFLDRHWTRSTPGVVMPELWRMLEAYDYPGNVRELAHLVERCCLLARDEHLSPDLLPSDLRDSMAAAIHEPGALDTDGAFQRYDNQELKTARGAATEAAVDRVERAFLTGLMARHDNDVKAAAEASGLNRTYLYRLLGKHKT
jgi:Nif-specific regulatory protein/two-component system response regulator HydG